MSGEGYNNKNERGSENKSKSLVLKRFWISIRSSRLTRNNPLSSIEVSVVRNLPTARHTELPLIFEIVRSRIGQCSVRFFVPHEHLLRAVVDAHRYDDSCAGSL